VLLLRYIEEPPRPRPVEGRDQGGHGLYRHRE